MFLLTPCWTFSYPEVLAHGSLFPGGLKSPGWVMALWSLTAPLAVLLWQCMDFLLSWTQGLAPPWSSGFLALFTTGLGPQEILDISLLSEAMARPPHLLQDFLGAESTYTNSLPLVSQSPMTPPSLSPTAVAPQRAPILRPAFVPHVLQRAGEGPGS